MTSRSGLILLALLIAASASVVVFVIGESQIWEVIDSLAGSASPGTIFGVALISFLVLSSAVRARMGYI